MHVALAQMNPVVGDIAGNARRISEALAHASDAGAQVVATPELAVTGYPPEDLLLKSSFVRANVQAVEEVARGVGEVLAIVGFVERGEGCLYNAAAVCHRGAVVAVYRKHLLPNYGVFDERRYFESGSDHLLVETPDGVIGITVCEDAWDDDGPVVVQGLAGAQVVVIINASPFNKGKWVERSETIGERARRARAAIVYVNTVGAQDELIFDGGSLVVGADGNIVARLPQFEEHFEVVEVPLGAPREAKVGDAEINRVRLELRPAPSSPPPKPPRAPRLAQSEEIYRGLRLALRDYVRKNGFDKVVMGLSGGIDSSLCAAIATDALGAERVLGVVLPSEFSTSHSRTDAKELAVNLGIEVLEIPISAIYNVYLEVLEEVFGRSEPGVAEENLQARIRGNLWMFISNRDGHLVIVAGNKSEGACGYATLYGDMAGGFALIKDIFKTEVYELSRYRNSVSPVIPQSVLTKAPSAELRHGQRDEDSLPPYEVLDPILEAYIEDDAGIEDLAAAGYDRATVEQVIALVDRAEYKRRQAPPGPKVTTKAFGRDRRLPISNAWREGTPPRLPAKVVGDEGPA